MRVVALTELRGDLDAEAPFLAPLLGLSTYDVKARFAGAIPKVLLQTADDEVARKVHRDISARGHGVVVVDAATSVPTSQMVHFHRFNLDRDGVWANGLTGDRLPWGDLGVIVVAVLRTSLSRTTEEADYQMPTLDTPSKVTYRVTRTEQSATHFAYFFPTPRATNRRPWVLEESAAQYLSLGRDMQPTRRANFFATIAAVRRLAPHAVFDDRFVASPLASHGAAHVHGTGAAPVTPPVVAVDLTVNILGAWLQREQRGPYR